MAEVTQEAGIKVDADPFGYGIENPQIPVTGIEVPAGNDVTNTNLFEVDVSGPSINETPIGEQQAENQDSSQQPARDDPSRFEYWQSQADKVKGELTQTQQDLAYFREQAMQSQQQTPPNGQPNGQLVQKDSLQSPVKPEKPINYNEVEAYNDPESASFKFRLNKEKYNDDYITFIEDRETKREHEYADRYQQAMVEQESNNLRTNAYSHVVSSYGWQPDQARNFVEWASNPNNVTVDHLAKLYQMKDAPNAQVQQRKGQIIKEREIASMPRTASVETGRSEAPMNDEDTFNAGMLGWKRT